MNGPEIEPLFVHAEGHVDVCFDDDGSRILTCGSDGDVRVMNGFGTEVDADSVTCGDSLLSVVCKNERFYVASDDHAIKIYTVKNGEPDGILTRFTAPVTHMCLSQDGKILVAGASDFAVKKVVVSSSEQHQLYEHEAPVLSVAMHPNNTMVASSSCDGSVKVYCLTENKALKTITGLPKSNDFGQSLSLCRLCFDKTGKYLVIPIEKEIKVYDTTTWEVTNTLTDDTIKEVFSIVSFSPCWRYLAATCRDGAILIYDFETKKCINREKHTKNLRITALCWNPKKKNEIVYADDNGFINLLKSAVKSSTPHTTKDNDQMTAAELTDLFDDDDDDDALVSATAASTAPEEEKEQEDEEPQDIHELLEGEAMEADDGDEDDITTPFRKNKVMRMEDDDSNDVDLGALKKSFLGDMDDDASSVASAPAGTAPVIAAPAPAPAPPGYQPTPMQPSFQSSSTPAYLQHRYMVWNSVGVIVQYNTEEENSINIEFHDTATHHAMHVVNTLNHTMADISHEAVLLACEADNDDEDKEESTQSQLVCLHFSTWDNCKEWSVAMPKGESIQAVCLGESWVAAATSQRHIRLFTLGGVQREVVSLAGPIVSMAGHTHQLIMAYHHSMGIPGDQSLGVRLVNVIGKKKTVISGDHLPLSAKSTLSWLGFTAEGTPIYIDSAGKIRMLARKMGLNWTQVANLRKHVKGKSDNFWVVSMHENPQQIRAIMCKGSRFPPAVPRPMVQILPYELPLCELTTEKGTIEETLRRSSIFYDHLDWWNSQGFEYDEASKAKSTMAQQEALMKLFALACKSEHEFRAVELCEMMSSSHTVQLAIKYASRLRMITLAQRLSQLAQQKAQQEQEGQGEEGEEEEEEEEEEIVKPVQSKAINKQTSKEEEEEEVVEEVEADVEEEDDPMNASQDIYEEIDQEGDEEEKQKAPVLKAKTNEKPSTPKTVLTSQQAKKNPFKLGSQKTPSTGKGSSVFDSLEKKKQNKVASPLNKPLPKPKITKKKSSGLQGKLFAPKKAQEEENEVENLPVTTPQTGFQLWLDENRADVQEEHPDLSEADLTLEAAKSFKQLTKEEKQKYNDRAKGETDANKKRKRIDSDDVSSAKKQSPALKNKALGQNTSSKLAAFSFGK